MNTYCIVINESSFTTFWTESEGEVSEAETVTHSITPHNHKIEGPFTDEEKAKMGGTFISRENMDKWQAGKMKLNNLQYGDA